jgi:hypothetical protein
MATDWALIYEAPHDVSLVVTYSVWALALAAVGHVTGNTLYLARNAEQTSTKSESGDWKWIPRPGPPSHSAQQIRVTWFQSAMMLLSVQWCDHVVATTINIYSHFTKIIALVLFMVGSLGYYHFNSFLKDSIDLKHNCKNLIPWDIDNTQACTTPITQIRIPTVNTHQISIYCCNDYFMHWVD